MRNTDLRTAPTIRLVYGATVDGKILTAEVVKETPKQLKIREKSCGVWMSTIDKAQNAANQKWHDSRRLALEARVIDVRGRIKRSQEELQHQRTWLGMLEGEISRLTDEP